MSLAEEQALGFFFLFFLYRATVLVAAMICNLPFPIVPPRSLLQRYRIVEAQVHQWGDRRKKREKKKRSEEETVLYVQRQSALREVHWSGCKMVVSLAAFDARWFIVPVSFVSMQPRFPMSRETPIPIAKCASRFSNSWNSVTHANQFRRNQLGILNSLLGRCISSGIFWNVSFSTRFHHIKVSRNATCDTSI